LSENARRKNPYKHKRKCGQQDDRTTGAFTNQRYRARADECRAKAQLFRDPKARAQMLQIAADNDRKAVQANEFGPHERKNS